MLLACLPLFHTFGQICGMANCFRAGATMVLMHRFDPGRAVDLMVRHRCTVMMGVPTMYLDLLEVLEAIPATAPRPALERAYCGGSPLPAHLLERFREVAGCEIYEGYGLTETSPVVSYNDRIWTCRPGTVGKPIDGVQVQIARADVDDRIVPLPPGELGEIVIRGPNVMAGYLNLPLETARAVVDGWFRSGDLGVLDEEGYLTIVDRKKDVVIRGGYNVYPREVEEVLMQHPAIRQVAVIGLPHPRLGEEVCAVVSTVLGVVPGPQLAADIIAFSRGRTAAYKYPRTVEFVDALPLGPSGKVLKRDLVAALARQPLPHPSAGPNRAAQPGPGASFGMSCGEMSPSVLAGDATRPGSWRPHQ
jgi:long-chain acyl-CoA synthetase